jgi:GT2 family glycosyltransferase
VVLATRDRPDRLEAALQSLRAQSVDPSLFEIVVVDDASTTPRTAEVLAAAAGAPGPALRAIQRPSPGGPSGARNDGWRAAIGDLVAFTDDDCELDPEWLAGGLAAWDGTDASFVQGATGPIPRERDRLGLFSYSILVTTAGPQFETCNIFYPRTLLERLGGFDETTYPAAGEDTDLAWRAMEAGATPVFAAGARAYHAVVDLDPTGLLRRALRWSDVAALYPRHPGLRDHLFHGLFWKWSHYLLARAALALLVPRRLGALRLWLVAPLIRYEIGVARQHGGGLRHVPWLLLHDSVEMAAIARGAIRHRAIIL